MPLPNEVGHDWAMSLKLTLPSLQSLLDGLGQAQTLGLTRKEVFRLFGNDDLTADRLSRFARSHGCGISHSDGLTVFEKQAAR